MNFNRPQSNAFATRTWVNSKCGGRRLVRRKLDSKSRSGFTLLELILVIAIVIVVAALAAPTVQRTIKTQGINGAAQRVKVAMGQARVQAIRSGEVHAVFFINSRGWFDVAPLSKFREIKSASSQGQANQTPGTRSDFEENLLPQGCQFIASQTSMDSRTAAAMSDSNAANQMEMILFYPDGTSQDARVQIQNDMGDVWQVELRGLTGLAKAMRVDPQANR